MITFTIEEEEEQESEQILTEEQVKEEVKKEFGEIYIHLFDIIEPEAVWFEYYGENKELEREIENTLQEMFSEKEGE